MRMEGFKKVHEDLERVIEKDDSGSSMSGSDEGKPHHGNHRDHIAHVMHSTKFQILIIALVILDCIMVVSELLIDCHHEQSHSLEVAGEVGGYSSHNELFVRLQKIYHQISNIRRTLVGIEIVDHSDVVGASPVGAAPTTSLFLT